MRGSRIGNRAAALRDWGLAWASYWLARFGWLYVGTALLLLLVVMEQVFHHLVAVPNLDELELRMASTRRQIVASTASRDQRMAAQQDAGIDLPQEGSIAEVVQAVSQSVGEAKLQARRIDYREPQWVSPGILRLQVVAPIQGDYPAVRAWVLATMQRFPASALDEISMQVDKPQDEGGTGTMQSKVVYSFYFRRSR